MSKPMSETEREAFIEGLVVTMLTGVRKWFEGKAAILVGQLEVRFKVDPES